MVDLAFKTIQEIQDLIETEKCSAEEVLDYFIARFKEIDPKLGSALEVFDRASILERVKCKGVLHGIPGLIKDNINQTGRSLTCASKILENFVSPYDATVIERLKDEGALLVGRANLDEFAMGSSTETSAYQKTKNPWNTECVPGGSSGGSAAAVSAGLVPWALGTDTGGSVRQPAAFCGIVGLKPTYGAVSRFGVVAYASSLDQVGVFSRTVHDNAKVFSVIAGHDERDASTLKLDKKDYTQGLDGKLPEGLRIGIVTNAMEAEGLDSEVKQIVEDASKQFEGMGATVTPVSLPALDYSAATYFIISRAEAASNLARFDGVRYGHRSTKSKDLAELYTNSRSEGFGKEVQVRMLVGNYVLSAGHAGQFYNNAKLVQNLIRKEFHDTFQNFDLLIMPTQSVPAFNFGAYDNNKLQMDLQDYFTAGMNLAGIPAMSIPCGFTKANMPIGMQLIGPHLSEELLFKVGHAYQQVTDWHKKHPKV
jgi:aspartyl-tRNA(Asn)/glutamyl-tRNA(Gln) amidotransferase subunit A